MGFTSEKTSKSSVQNKIIASYQFILGNTYLF
ncbi:hypothetical protein JOD96_002064 [Flavobacterium sp. 1355]|nr:hypothetical protein [Flavobacterium sp. 1355]